MTWDEAMDKYGSDKPDLRFGMELINMTEAVKGSEFKVFNDIIDKGGIVKAINVKGDAGIPRRELDGLVNFVAIYGAKGLAWMQIQPDGSVKSPIAKFFSEEYLANILKTAEAEPGDLLLFVADKIFLCLLPTPAKYMPKLTTWYLTAPKSAAVPSVSTDATCRTQYSMLLA